MRKESKRSKLESNVVTHETIVSYDDEFTDDIDIQLTAFTDNDDNMIKKGVFTNPNTGLGQECIFIDPIWFGDPNLHLGDEVLPSSIKKLLSTPSKVTINYTNICTDTTITLYGRIKKSNQTIFPNLGRAQMLQTRSNPEKLVTTAILIPADDSSRIDRTVDTVEGLLPVIDDLILKLQRANAKMYKATYIANRTEKKLYEAMAEANKVKRWNIWQRLKWLFFGY